MRRSHFQIWSASWAGRSKQDISPELNYPKNIHSIVLQSMISRLFLMTHFVQRVLKWLKISTVENNYCFMRNNDTSHWQLYLLFLPSSSQEQCLLLLSGQRQLFFSKSRIQILKLSLDFTLCKLDVIKTRIHCCFVRTVDHLLPNCSEDSKRFEVNQETFESCGAKWGISLFST